MKWTGKIFLIYAAFFLSQALQGQELDLKACVTYALERSHSLLEMEWDAELASMDERDAKSFVIPEIQARGNMDYYWRIPVLAVPGELVGEPGEVRPVRFGTPWMGEAGVQAQWNLLDPSAWNQAKLSKLAKSVQEAGFTARRRELIKHVHMAYRALQVQQYYLESAAESLENYLLIHDLLQKQFDKGFIDQIALNQSRSILTDHRKSLAARESEKAMAEADLKFWMGYPMDGKLAIVPEPEPEDLSLNTDFEEERLPEYRFHQNRLTHSRQAYLGSRNAWLPALHAKAAYNYMYFGERLSLGSSQNWLPVGFLGIGLQFPVFSIGKHFRQPGRKKLEWRKTEAAMTHYLEKERHRSNQALLRYEAARYSLDAARENYGLALENVRLGQQKLDKGRVDMIEWKQMQQDLIHARDRMYAAEMDLYLHYVELVYLADEL